MDHENQHPWQKQRGESTQAYNAFSAYRNLGIGRSCRIAAESLGKSIRWFEVLCSKWSWVERAAAWDAYNLDLEDAELIAQRKRMAERHAQLAQNVLQKVQQGLELLSAKDMTSEDITKLMVNGVAIERQARGASSRTEAEAPSFSIALTAATPPPTVETVDKEDG